MVSFVENENAAGVVASLLKTLGHPQRLRIVELLAERDCSVSEMVETLGIAQSAVSQQLRLLRLEGIVKAQRDGGRAVYTLIEDQLRDLLTCLKGCRRAARA